MKELVVISGKGGSGKTTLTAAFASLATEKVLCDADVDAADLHLIVKPDIRESHPFMAGHTAAIRPDDCTRCGKCIEVCRFSAINADFAVDPIACEGCGVCVYFCEAGAIDFPENRAGDWFVSDTRFGPMVHARLGIAEENSGKLVTQVRKAASEIAKSNGYRLILTDGPPGVGCPVIAAIGGASAVLIVTEPTLSGKSDMERVVELAKHFSVPALVLVNKYDLNEAMTVEIERFSEAHRVTAVGRIPFDPVFTKSMVQARTIFEYDPAAAANRTVEAAWERICGEVGI